MRYISKAGMVLAGLLIFIVSFLLGASLTKTTPGLILFATGINHWEYQGREQSMLISSDGQELARLGYKRIYSEDFPDFLKQTVVAVEDKRFYQHAGLDTRGIGRAIWNDLKTASKEEGGSTITQQLARTLFLSQDKTMSRKIKEVFIATALEEKFGKDAILNMYLNEIYMGRGCSGMATAAHYYFGKDVYSLTKSEICLLVGIIQSPEFYSPEHNFDGLKARQETVINVLLEQNITSTEETENLKAGALHIKAFEPEKQSYPYITAYVTPELEHILGSRELYQGGLKIYLTLDSRVQKAAEKAVKNNVRSFSYRGISAGDAS
ncbi:MAG: transglycosylase domain-containing protein, partial [Syntrophomonas sp.]